MGSFLGPSIRDFYARYPLAALAACWQHAGFEQVRVRRMSLGGGIVMSARRGGGSTSSQTAVGADAGDA